MSNSAGHKTSSKSEHIINTTSQKSNDTITKSNNDQTKVFKLPPIIHTGNSSTTTTTVHMNDDKINNGRRSLRKKIVPPKRYAKSPINTIDEEKISSSTNDMSVQPTSVPPPTNTTANTKQSNKTTESTSLNNTTKKQRASPRKIKILSRYFQDGSPTINNLDGALNHPTVTAVAAMNPQQQQQPTDINQSTSNVVGGGSRAVPTKRSSSRKITIPARFTNEEAQQISATCHSISNNQEPNMQGLGSTDMGQGIVDNNASVEGLGLRNEAVVAASRSSSKRSLPPVIHNNNNPISLATGTTSASSGAVQQPLDEKPKRGQAGRDALKAKHTAAAAAATLATTEDDTNPLLLAKKKQQTNKKEVTVTKKRSSRRKVPPPSSTNNSKSLSKLTNSKTVTVTKANSGVKRTPAQLKYDTNRPIHTKWLNYYTLLQSYKLKYSSTIVINSTGPSVGIDINSLGKGSNSKSGKYRHYENSQKVQQEVTELNKWIGKQYLAYKKWKLGFDNTGFSQEKFDKLKSVGLVFDADAVSKKEVGKKSGKGKKTVKGSKKEVKEKSQDKGRTKDEKGRFIKATADQGEGDNKKEAKGTRFDKGVPTGRFHGNQHTKKKEEEAAAAKKLAAEGKKKKKKKVDGRKNNGRKSIKVAAEDEPSASEGMKKKMAVPSKPSKIAASNKKTNEEPKAIADEPSTTTTIQHNDLCEVCAQPGELLSCTTCNLVFHTHCTRPKLDDINNPLPPGNNWNCSYCLSAGGSRQFNNPSGLGLLDLRKKVDREKQLAAKEGVLEMEEMKRVLKEEQEQMLVDEVAKEMAAVDDHVMDRKMPAATGSNFQEDHNDVFNIFQDDDQGIHTMSQDALMNEDILTQESLQSASAAGGAAAAVEVAPKIGDAVNVMFDKNQKYTAKIIAVEESDDPADGYEDQQAYDIQIQYDDDGAIEDAKYPDAEITLVSSSGGSSRRKGGVRTAKTAGARGIVVASKKSALPSPSKISSKTPSKMASSKASKFVSSTLASFKELTPEPTKEEEKHTPKKRKVYTKREEDPIDETFILSLHSPEDTTEVNPLHNAIRRDVWEVRRTMSGKIFFQCGCCKHLPRNKREQLAIVAPQNVETIYRAFIRFMGKHVKKCKHLPKSITKLVNAQVSQEKKDGGIWRGTRAYWAESASRLGLVDSEDGKSITFCPLAAAGTKKPFKAPPKKKRKKNKAPTEEKKVELVKKESVSKSGRKRKSTQRLMEQDQSDEDDYETLPSPAKRPAYHRSASSDAAMSSQGMDYEPSPAKLPAYQRSLSLNSAMIGRGIKGGVPLCSSRHCKKHAVFDGVCAAHGAMQRLYTSNKKLSLSTPLPGLAPKRKRSARKRSPTSVGDMDMLSSPSAMMPPTPYTVQPSKPTVSFAAGTCNPGSQVNQTVMPVASHAQQAAEPLYTDPVDQLLGNGNLEDFVDMKAGSLPGSPLKSPTKRDQELVDIRSLPSPTKREAFGRSPGAGEDDEMFAQMWLS